MNWLWWVDRYRVVYKIINEICIITPNQHGLNAGNTNMRFVRYYGRKDKHDIEDLLYYLLPLFIVLGAQVYKSSDFWPYINIQKKPLNKNSLSV